MNLHLAEFLCTIGKALIGLAIIVGAVPALLLVLPVFVAIVGFISLKLGEMIWNEIHGIPFMWHEPETAEAEAEKLEAAWGNQS